MLWMVQLVMKTGIIRTLMRRGKQICNTADHEWHHLIRVFQSNGYLRAFIQKAMNPKKNSTKDKQAASLTTIKGTSERIRQCLRISGGHSGCFQEQNNHEISPHVSQTATIPNGIQRGDLQNTILRLWSSLQSTLGRQGDLWSQE